VPPHPVIHPLYPLPELLKLSPPHYCPYYIAARKSFIPNICSLGSYIYQRIIGSIGISVKGLREIKIWYYNVCTYKPPKPWVIIPCSIVI